MSIVRQLSLVAASLLVAVGLGTVSMTPVSAHAGLIGTSPSAGSTLENLPSEVRLTFNEDMNRPSYVSVTAPDGSLVAEGEGRIEANEVVQTTADPGFAGTYRVDYRVISADGHPVSGEYEFDVTTGEVVEPSAGSEQATSESDSSSSLWWIAAIAALWVILLVGWILRRRRRSAS